MASTIVDHACDRASGKHTRSLRAHAAEVLRRILHPIGGELRYIRESVAERGGGTGIEYWRDGLHWQARRFYEICFGGHVIVRFPTKRKRQVYWRSRRDLVTLIKDLNGRGLLPPLGRGSIVFESGCSVAQNLWDISRHWELEVHGLDIDEHALDLAIKRRWRRPARFYVGNVLEADTFSRFPDGYFDLVLTRWHLLHVPPGDAKRHCLRELRRIGKAGLILEPSNASKSGTVEWAEGGKLCFAWDNWTDTYGLKPVVPKVPIEYTDVFYW